jgi:hypothetical protein
VTEDSALSAPESSADNATLVLTTTPPGAIYAVYSGVVAGKSAPASAPLRAGSAPDSITDLPPGRYTLFFHNEGWPDDRAEVSVSARESVPVDYTFPHGTANITSSPNGAEVFLGTKSLGNAPLTVDLPLGKQRLVAKFADMADRSQVVTIESATSATVNFQMRERTRSSKARATPPPSALSKIGDSLKHVFGGSENPTPPSRKRH